MNPVYHLEKTLWTEADFDRMSWHDCPIHALAFGKYSELLLDIDYIFKWVLLTNKKKYKFWIAPCTLVFENVYDIELGTDHTTVIIDNISRHDPESPKNAAFIKRDVEYDWVIETTVGQISFKSAGFKQYVRSLPILIREQALDLETRGGISFDLSY
jgi:hypothetical protein